MAVLTMEQDTRLVTVVGLLGARRPALTLEYIVSGTDRRLLEWTRCSGSALSLWCLGNLCGNQVTAEALVHGSERGDV